jgi:ketosteroid isomerase-like protein
MTLLESGVDKEKNSTRPISQGPAETQRPIPKPALPPIDEFLKPLTYEVRWPKPSPEAVAAAVHAVQEAAVESDTNQAVDDLLMERVEASPAKTCPVCGDQNQDANRFCGSCGSPLPTAVREASATAAAENAAHSPAPQAGQHHYHHHYHHHFFPSGAESGRLEANSVARISAADRSPKEVVPTRAPMGAPAVSRAEATIRKLTQDWALACNTKQLDDLVDLYAPDALVLRSNFPPVRGTAAIREFFFAALDAGLGEVEMEALRVEIWGDVAYEAGRCQMLVPYAVGKRREERGKYLVIFARQKNGEWKAIADCWSSDLTLAVAAEPEPAKSPAARSGMPRKSA